MAKTPAGAQRLLLSATLDGDVDKLVNRHLRDPKLHELDPPAGAVETMEHHVMVVGGYGDKLDAVARLVDANPRSIVFTRTREGATELRDKLADRGIGAVDLHDAATSYRPYQRPLLSSEALEVLWRQVEKGWRRADVVEHFAAVLHGGETQSIIS